jgi:hypothetical protein
MAQAPTPPLGGALSERFRRDTLAETGPALPDEAIGPEQRTIEEQLDLADSPEGRRIEAKLRAEALARRVSDDDLGDPTGHA